MFEHAINNALEYLSEWFIVILAYGIIKGILFIRIEDKGYLHNTKQKFISYLLGISISIITALIYWFFSKSHVSTLTTLFIMIPASFFAVYNLYAMDKLKNK